MIASQGLLHARYGGVVPEIASRRHLELVDAVVADALERGGARLDDVDRVAVTRGPGLIGALLVGLSCGEGAGRRRGLPLVPVDHLHGHVTAQHAQPDPIEPPYLCLVASGGHTFLARVDDPRELHGARPDARRRGRRGVRQGRPPARARLPGRAGARPARARGRPGGVRLPAQRAGRARLQLPRAQDRSALPRSATSRTPTTPTSPRRYQRAIVEALVARTRAALEREGLERLAIGGGVAANSELRAAVDGPGRARSGCRRPSSAPTTRR